MAQFSRTWWGQRFLAALEAFTDSGRLGRGRSYASSGRIVEHQLADGQVTATVRGSINPYFGVYKEPLYRTTVALARISRADWTRVVGAIAARAGFITRLLMNEMPDAIEEAFVGAGLHLLPHAPGDFSTSCSCPDWANPCKHLAGVTYLLASELDEDPFLLFELRGLPRQALRAELEASPLGRILAADLAPRELPIVSAATYHTLPVREAPAREIDYRTFWMGAARPPEAGEGAPRLSVPALLVKKQGDYPPFWHRDGSFIAVMEELYERVRKKQLQAR